MITSRPLFALALLILASMACTPKPAINTPPSAPPPEPETQASGPKLACPPNTEQKQAHIAKGTEHYCTSPKGKTGPSILIDKAGNTLVKREYSADISTGSIELFHEGIPMAEGTFSEGWLATLTYKDAPPVHRGPDFFLVENQIKRAGLCERDDECVSRSGVCPLGCDLIFNKTHQSKVDTWLKAFKGNCEYRCMAQTGALKCEHNQCVRTHH